MGTPTLGLENRPQNFEVGKKCQSTPLPPPPPSAHQLFSDLRDFQCFRGGPEQNVAPPPHAWSSSD